MLESCLSRGIAPALRAEGHDVVCVGDWPDDPQDEQILAFALKEGRTIVTLEKEFSELAAAFGRAHAGIIRLVNFPCRSTPRRASGRSRNMARNSPRARS